VWKDVLLDKHSVVFDGVVATALSTSKDAEVMALLEYLQEYIVDSKPTLFRTALIYSSDSALPYAIKAMIYAYQPTPSIMPVQYILNYSTISQHPARVIISHPSLGKPNLKLKGPKFLHHQSSFTGHALSPTYLGEVNLAP
jgi:hypothetical protein